MKKRIPRIILLAILFASSTPVDSEQLPNALTVLTTPSAAGPRITSYLQYQTNVAWMQDDMRRKRFDSVRTSSAAITLRDELRGRLLRMLGGLPAVKTPLNPQITGTVEGDGFRVEKVIFESLPRFYVTALLYIPANRPPDNSSSPNGPGFKFRHPAVLVPCGHAPDGKFYYQGLCQRLVKRGYVVLCWDPVGQGERSQFWDERAGRSRYNLVCGEHAVMGNLAVIAGTTLARWEIWDGIRALDYLLTRPEVNPNRISITGTSGGGFQAAHIAALDDRIGVAAPSCYISALPMRMYNRIFEDPDTDPEQDLYGMVSGGVDHAGLLLLMYPRPVIVCAAVLDFFPIEGTRQSFREVSRIYQLTGHAERIALHEGYHKHQYSDENQRAAFEFLDRFNEMPRRAGLDAFEKLDGSVLRCTKSGQVMLDRRDARSVLDLVGEYYLAHRNEKRPSLASIYHNPSRRQVSKWPVHQYQGSASGPGINWQLMGSSEVEGALVDRYLLHHSGALTMPLLHIHRRQAHGRFLLWFKPDGKATADDWPAVMRHVNDGYQVVTFDFRGLGEDRMPYRAASPDDPNLAPSDAAKAYQSPISGVLANYVYNSLLTGTPYFLQMIEDVEIAAQFARLKLAALPPHGDGILRTAAAPSSRRPGNAEISLFISGSSDADLLVSSASEALSLTRLSRPQEPLSTWSRIVEQRRVDWPIQYLLPGGAYLR